MTSTNMPPQKKKVKKVKPVLAAVPEDGHPGASRFAQALGSCDYQTREQGVRALTRWLTRNTEITEVQMLKIWKGVFYCFWHSDKAPVQQELAERLAAILTQLNEQSAYRFYAAFITTMRREWFGIDRLRLDKFLMLIRKFVRQMLACLKASKWRSDLVQRYADHLRAHVLLPDDTLSAAGLGYHVADLLLEELRGVADGKEVPGRALGALLLPFGAALQVGEQVVLTRIGEGLFDSLLSELASPTDDSPYLAQLDVPTLAQQLFDLGAAPETRARNRQVLYDLSSALEKTQRKRARVDTGAQAGTSQPAAAGKAGAKGKQQQGKERQAAAAATPVPAAAAAAAPLANGTAGADGKRKRKAGAAEDGPAQQREREEEQEEPSARKKLAAKKTKTLEAAAAVEDEEPGPAPTPATGGKKGAKQGAAKEPTSGMKSALRMSVAKAGQGQAPEAATTPAAKGKQGKPAATPQPQPAKQAAESSPASAGKASALGKRAARGAGAAAAEAAAGKKTPQPAAGGAGARTPRATTGKKPRVVINLKNNLYFEHGGPVPDPDIRTPPPARAKGGILKKSAQTCPPKVAGARGGKANSATSAQKPQSARQQAQQRVLPKQARRASAALFF
ncbi:hypothetical protein HYH03_008165 [Edaphochlamys debaryana]|uniref:Uncharacterized protein n=1 Tax=Edaphochlamys debaryana TaxID=47281 RepID=A0A836BZQ4_9CHLO|nr:hypothetical protein HYH03_008165 [Edaphochlamys debaryana]|eukprot:KAG2493648.1 hypothetical protein HYH03_008165 [Edaphochlamys debaryana]